MDIHKIANIAVKISDVVVPLGASIVVGGVLKVNTPVYSNLVVRALSSVGRYGIGSAVSMRAANAVRSEIYEIEANLAKVIGEADESF